MKISDIINFLEILAHPALQESYDNAGLLTGNASQDCTGVVCTLDSTEDVVQEAIDKKCNLIVAHHPIIFKGLKKINGKNYVGRTIIKAIKNDIALYAIHTNLDNVTDGVNKKMAEKLGLINTKILLPKENTLYKLYTFAPVADADKIRNAVFAAGAGHIGNYAEAGFGSEGVGTFKPLEGANPYIGEMGKRHYEKEIKLEFIFPAWLESKVIKALTEAHPYEEVAYDIIKLENKNPQTGSGLIGDLPKPIDEKSFLNQIKTAFGLKWLRHTGLKGSNVKRVALCGGAGSFLISNALAAGADFYISADFKYHEFFDAENRLVIADIGHYESEQFTIDLLYDLLVQKFTTFAVLKTGVNTNPVYYF